MGNSVDHGQAGPVPAKRCPHCHASTGPRKRSWGDLFNSVFYWTLIIVNIVVLSLGTMEQNQPPLPFKEDPDCWSDYRLKEIGGYRKDQAPPKVASEGGKPSTSCSGSGAFGPIRSDRSRNWGSECHIFLREIS
jgi:hypothetical protein